MWIFRLVLVLLMVLLAFYYVTVVLHVLSPIFKKGINKSLLWLPFYGWIKGL